MGPFKTGIGMLVAGTSIPVVPCYIDGAGRAMSVTSRFVRPERLTIRIGQPLQFADLPDNREGWQQTTHRLEAAVHELGDKLGSKLGHELGRDLGHVPADSQPAKASACNDASNSGDMRGDAPA